jgi:hypothetical protein
MVLLIGSTVLMTSLSTPASNASDKNQLKVTAEKIMAQILLDPGYASTSNPNANPYEWGSLIEPRQNLNLTVFGLAKSGVTSRQAYELDPDKVLRLNNTIATNAAYYIQPGTAANLLGLTLTNSPVNAITVTNGGSGYSTVPQVKILGGGGTGAAAVATIDTTPSSPTYEQVTSITVTKGGSGYAITPNVTISGGGGTGATAISTLVNEYGFTLEFSETIHVSGPQPKIGGSYSITVSSEYNLPIIGANVSTTLYYIDAARQIVSEPPIYGKTAYDGSFTLPLDFNQSSTSEVLITAVNYYGAQFVKFYTTASTLNATLLGSNILADEKNAYSLSNSAAREILLMRTSQGLETKSFVVGSSGTPTNFILNAPPESSAIGVLAVSGKNLLVAWRDFSAISYRTIPAVRSAPSAYSLQRTVLIDGSSYTAMLYIWRMAT